MPSRSDLGPWYKQFVDEQRIVHLDGFRRRLIRNKGLSVIGRGVGIRKSLINKAGNGLFAERAFSPNEIITEYTGLIIEYIPPNKLPWDWFSHSRALTYKQFTIIGNRTETGELITDAAVSRRGEGGAAFINDARIEKMDNVMFTHINTVTFDDALGRPEKRLWDGRMMVAIATRNIQSGEELYVPYGENFWKREEEERCAPKFGLNPPKFVNVRLLKVDPPAATATSPRPSRRITPIPRGLPPSQQPQPTQPQPTQPLPTPTPPTATQPQPTPKRRRFKAECTYCHAKDSKLQCCVCKQPYCSSLCQVGDWSVHQLICEQ